MATNTVKDDANATESTLTLNKKSVVGKFTT